jgi:hypothetical protein
LVSSSTVKPWLKHFLLSLVMSSISPSFNVYSWWDSTVSFSNFSSLLSPPSVRITDLTRAHVTQKWTSIFSPCLYAFSTFLHAHSQTSSSKVPSSGNQGLYSQITSKQSFNYCWNSSSSS